MACNKLAKLALLKNGTNSYKYDSNNIKALLDCGLDINYAVSLGLSSPQHQSKWLGYTALHFVVDNNDCWVSLLKSLLTSGVDFTCKNNNGFTPLRLAYEKHKRRNTMIDALLLAHLKSKNEKNPSCNDNISHLHIACILGYSDVVKFFLENGASINDAISSKSKVFPGCTLLHIAAENGDEAIFNLLLNHGANEQSLNARGLSPLHLIVEKQMYFTHCTRTKNVCDSRLRINEKMFDMIFELKNNLLNANCFGISKFHIYCTRISSFKKEVWDEFLTNGVNVNAAVNSDSPICAGYTALHFAAHCNLKTVMLLLENGANIMIKDTSGKTPLDICFDRYNPESISCVFKSQNDGIGSIKFQNGENLSDVIAAFSTSPKLEQYLEDHDVNNVIAENPLMWSGFSLLHLAVILSPEIDRFRVQMCVRKGADIMKKDANNMTAFHLAFRMGRKRCIQDIQYAHNDFSENPVDNGNLSHFLIACTAYNGSFKKIIETYVKNGEDMNAPMPNEDFKCTVILSPLKCTIIPAGSRPLHIAVATGYERLTKFLLYHSVDSDLLDAHGFTWIQRAFMSENFKKFKPYLWLDNKSLKSNQTAPGGLSHLHVACWDSNKKAVKALLSMTTNVNEPITSDILKYVTSLPKSVSLGDTPLHLAAKSMENLDSEEIITLLLAKGADPKSINENGLNPLHEALLTKKSMKIVHCLVTELDKTSNWSEEIGLTGLHVACYLKDLSRIKEFLKKKVDINKNINSDSLIWPGMTPLDLLIEETYPKNDECIKEILNYIIEDMEKSVIADEEFERPIKRQKTILDINRQNFYSNQDGQTAFHVSCMGRDPEIVERFLKLGADVNAPKDFLASVNAGYTPLHYALVYGSNDVLELLLKYGADIHLENSNGDSPLLLACLKKMEKMDIFFRNRTIDFSTKNSFGRSIIHVLNEKNLDGDTYLNLLGKGCGVENVDAATKMKLVKNFILHYPLSICKSFFESNRIEWSVDTKGRNIIHNIVEVLHLEYEEICKKFKLLIKRGCKLDQQDNTGNTPLHLAVKSHAHKAVRALLSVGADINIKDKSGCTPFMSSNSSVNTGIFTEFYRSLCEYIEMLKIVGLYINPENEIFYEKNKFFPKKIDTLKIFNLMCPKEVVPACKRISLYKFLTEDVVMKLFVFFRSQKELNLQRNNELLQTCVQWSFIFKSQYKSICDREKLYEDAIDALDVFFEQKLPFLCLDIIFEHLNNQDCKNVIKAQKLL